MKLLGKLCAACVCGIFVAAVVTMLNGSNGRRSDGDAAIYLPNRTLDLGEVKFQEVREVRFVVENHGRRRLVINELDEACGCGRPEKRTILIPPGGVDALIVSIDTRFSTGTVEKRTSFSTSDPVQPRFELRVKANVLPVATLDADLDQRGQRSILMAEQE